MLPRQTSFGDPAHPVDPSRRDRGVTFVELLVSIVLLGTTVIAVLAATRTVVIGTSVERDHSKAQQWLQSAAALLEATEREPCDPAIPDGSNVQAEYRTAVQAAAVPEGWSSTTATIDVDVPKVWDGSSFVPFSSQPGVCYDTTELQQQLVRITVTSPDGSIVESVEVVKREL